MASAAMHGKEKAHRYLFIGYYHLSFLVFLSCIVKYIPVRKHSKPKTEPSIVVEEEMESRIPNWNNNRGKSRMFGKEQRSLNHECFLKLCSWIWRSVAFYRMRKRAEYEHAITKFLDGSKSPFTCMVLKLCDRDLKFFRRSIPIFQDRQFLSQYFQICLYSL